MSFNDEQLKYIAGIIDKVAVAYFSVIGYTAWNGGNWMLFGHAVLGFGVLEAIGLWVLGPRRHQKEELDDE